MGKRLTLRRAWLFQLLALLLSGSVACKRSSAPASSAAPYEPIASGQKDPWAAKGAPTKAATKPEVVPMVWRATKDGKATYFLGTMHLGVDAESRLPAWVWNLHKAAPVFAMETNLADPSLLTAGIRKVGYDLKSELGDVYWAKLEATLGPGMAKSLNGMTVPTVASMVSIRGLPMTAPMDMVLANRAREGKKQQVYLEAAAKQQGILEKWMDLRMLKHLLDDVEAVQANNSELLAAYEAGDAARIAGFADKEKAEFIKSGRTEAEYQAMMKDLLFDRNASWIAELERIHLEGNGFVAVGALHLVGPGSVLELLGQKGFQVDRLTSQP